ncbi:MAG: Molybdenum transport ATP-binding protein ModC [uncultured Thermomicrobiales bacterium]|uniref:Molybdenum transport ATP-binding protein ModC n=1 Tax=uncultured Thermomicrobiales bacterium TaxID=1645740 RepID=A0A6J4V4B2_9BACT|nr:MAG: Molybdenum transport ATP-binding protein ModC [uncultured Thermomicrobiales bacterium]
MVAIWGWRRSTAPAAQILPVASRADLAASPAPVLELANVRKVYQGDRAAVDGLSLTLFPGEILALLGPSGCGKTTTLRLLAGFERPDGGDVFVGGRRVAGAGTWLPPEHRHLGMVFQDYALFPHLTAAQNIAFGLRGERGAAKGARVAELLRTVGLADLGNRYPHQLSGGQQQRIALARALAPRPAAILLDEPFNSLDAAGRTQVRAEVRDILRAEGAAAILVTHDQAEAFAMADRIAVLNQGRLEQIATPTELYHAPRTRFVAGFLGLADFLPAAVTTQALETEAGCLPNPGVPVCARADLLLRPEDIGLAADPSGPATVIDREFRGAALTYTLRLPCGQTLRSERPSTDLYAIGARVRPELRPSHLILFDGDRTIAFECMANQCSCQGHD